MSPRYLVANVKDGVPAPPGSERTYAQCVDCGSDVYWTLPKGTPSPVRLKDGIVVCGGCAHQRWKQGQIDLKP